MAVTITPLGLDTLRAVHDADADNTYENVGGTTLYTIDFDNTANAALSYLKFYNTGNPTVGTTAPAMIIHSAVSVRRLWHFIGGNSSFDLGLAFAGLTAGGTAGTTSPTSNVVVDLVVEG